MKIGIVIPALPNYSETFFMNKIRGLVESGLIVCVFISSNNNNRISLPKNVSIYTQPDINKKIALLFKLIFLLISCPKIICRFIKLERISGRKWKNIFINIIINSHIINKRLDWVHFGFTTMGIHRENVALAIGARSAVSFRGFDIGLYPHYHPNCYRLLWMNIDKVHTISDNLYKKAIDLGLSSQIPMQKITPAIDINKFKTKVFEKLHDPLRILTVGRLTWIKGVEYGLSAMKILREKGIKFEYRIIGEGKYCEPIKYAIHQLELDGCVTLLGRKTHDEVITHLEWADIYIQPSLQEGFCNAALEAQAIGLLCIVTDADGLSENVLDGKTGWVVQKRSAKELSKKIINIITMDDDRLNQVRQYASKRVTHEFNLELQSQLFRDFYH